MRIMDYSEEREYVGNLDQIFKLLPYQMAGGKADGVKMLNVQDGSGLSFDVNLDRGLDLPYLSYKGNNMSYIAPCGIVAPPYFDDKGIGFLKSFTAGFLTTCGLQNIGNPGTYEGKEYGLHGNIANTPAKYTNYEIADDEEGNPVLKMKGVVEEGVIFSDRLSLTRNITCAYKSKKIVLRDTVKNTGFKTAQHMILYHINIGYPLLSPDSQLFIPAKEVLPRNEHSRSGLHNWSEITEPIACFEEMCFFHKLRKDNQHNSIVGIYNHKLEIGLAIEFNALALDHFVQWKMLGKGDYVMGLEPCNGPVDGVEDAYQRNKMKFLKPQQEVSYDITFQILDGLQDLESLCAKMSKELNNG